MLFGYVCGFNKIRSEVFLDGELYFFKKDFVNKFCVCFVVFLVFFLLGIFYLIFCFLKIIEVFIFLFDGYVSYMFLVLLWICVYR